jgi:dihydroneopterin aldolase
MGRSPSISIEGIELRGHCGVSDEERAVGQVLVIDVRLEPSECPGTETDEVCDTIDYAHLVDVVRAVVASGEFHLLERLATVIADSLWDELDLAFLEVAVTKPAPPVAIPVRAARVEVVRTA